VSKSNLTLTNELPWALRTGIDETAALILQEFLDGVSKKAIFVTTASHQVRPASGNVRSLPLELWPEADRNAWNAACRPAARLKGGGAAAHLKPVTRDDLAQRYGYFLDFLDRRGLLQSEGPTAANVTVDNVEAYIAELTDRVSSVTIYGSISKLRRAAQLIAPGRDFVWLAEIESDLAMVMRPRSKFDRLVTSEVLVEAGLTLIHEAENSPNMTELARARQVRDGLMLALLGFCPIRLKNFAALEIGRSFVQIRGRYWILLSASETKEKRPDERQIDKLLTPFIDRYLNRYRPVLARTDLPPSALWLSSRNGSPMSYNRIRHMISMTTLATVGVKVSPHLFRTSAASTVASRAGENPYFASALLHHTHPSVTESHYNRATSLTAAESLRQIVRQYEKK
jgi:site-specific recombinase XerD